MKKILVPTDFTGKSMDVLSDYLLQKRQQEVEVLFFNGIKLSDSITDLLLLSRRTKEIEMVPKSFESYCKCIQEEFNMVKKVQFEFFYGNTMALFRNFLLANQIDEIVYDPQLKLTKLSKSSLDLVDIIKRCRWEKWMPLNMSDKKTNLKEQDAFSIKVEEEAIWS